MHGHVDEIAFVLLARRHHTHEVGKLLDRREHRRIGAVRDDGNFVLRADSGDFNGRATAIRSGENENAFLHERLRHDGGVLRPAVVVDGVLVRHANAVVTQNAGCVDFLDGYARAVPLEISPVGVTAVSVVVGIHATEVVDFRETDGRKERCQKQHEQNLIWVRLFWNGGFGMSHSGKGSSHLTRLRWRPLTGTTLPSA